MSYRFSLSFAFTLLLLAGCETSPGPAPAVQQQLPIVPEVPAIRLADIPTGAFASPEVVVQAPWGTEDGAVGRETDDADVGPMAVAAETDGGVALLDTVGGRIYRYGPDGVRRESIQTHVETADDLVVLENGTLALLVYRRLPSPRHVVLQRSRDGEWQQPITVPADITLPTGLLADGARLYVEQRHGWLTALDASPGVWGRPAGAVLVRVQREDDGSVTIEARDRQDERAWLRRLECPWPVTDIVALEASSAHVAVVVRHIEDESEARGAVPGHETWLVALSGSGEPLGRTLLVDRRITDAGRPVTLAPDGDVFELQTDETGVTVLRHRFGGAR
jgi:hypothetical protein